MSDFPDWLIEITDRASDNHPDDIPAATDQAFREAKRHPEFETVIEGLMRESIRDLINDARHKVNCLIKRQTGYFDKIKPKVTGVSEAVLEVNRSVYDYRINGKTLGNVMGCELDAIINNESAMMQGHQFKFELARWLKPHVPDDKSVRESVPERKLRANFRRIHAIVYPKDNLG